MPVTFGIVVVIYRINGSQRSIHGVFETKQQFPGSDQTFVVVVIGERPQTIEDFSGDFIELTRLSFSVSANDTAQIFVVFLVKTGFPAVPFF